MLKCIDEALKIHGFTGPVELTTMAGILDILAENENLKNSFETGYFYGRTAKLISDFSCNHMCCDPNHDSNLKNIVFFKESSKNTFPKIADKTFDFIFIDGSHYKDDVKFDLDESAKLLTENGVILMDDTYYIDYPEVVNTLEVFLEKNTDFEKLLMLPTQTYIIRKNNKLKNELLKRILKEIPKMIINDCLIYNFDVIESTNFDSPVWEKLSYPRYKYNPEYYSSRLSRSYLNESIDILSMPPTTI